MVDFGAGCVCSAQSLTKGRCSDAAAGGGFGTLRSVGDSSAGRRCSSALGMRSEVGAMLPHKCTGIWICKGLRVGSVSTGSSSVPPQQGLVGIGTCRRHSVGGGCGRAHVCPVKLWPVLSS